MNAHEDRENKSEELKDSDLDNVAGGTGTGENPPPMDEEQDPGSIEHPGDPGQDPGHDPGAPPPDGM